MGKESQRLRKKHLTRGIYERTVGHMRTSEQTEQTVDWTDPKWSLPNVMVSASWGPGIEGK